MSVHVYPGMYACIYDDGCELYLLVRSSRVTSNEQRAFQHSAAQHSIMSHVMHKHKRQFYHTSHRIKSDVVDQLFVQFCDNIRMSRIFHDVDVLALPIQTTRITNVRIQLPPDNAIVIRYGHNGCLVEFEPASVSPLIHTHGVTHDLRGIPLRSGPEREWLR